MKITALCGGVGGAKLALGLDETVSNLTLIANTGDDFNHYGLTICPDIDTILYTLSATSNTQQGWGRADECFGVRAEMESLGEDLWFLLGDKDIALHLIRTERLRRGDTLTQTIKELTQKLKIKASILPMSDHPAPTKIETDQGLLDFQDYFVHRKCAPKASDIIYSAAELSPSALASLNQDQADAIIFCPSNPLLSIAPILNTFPMRDTLISRSVPSLAVSPFIDGKAVKGPTEKLFDELGYQSDSLGVAHFYKGLIDIFVIDPSESHLASKIEQLGIKVCVTNTLMKTSADKIRLANDCIDFLHAYIETRLSVERSN